MFYYISTICSWYYYSLRTFLKFILNLLKIIIFEQTLSHLNLKSTLLGNYVSSLLNTVFQQRFISWQNKKRSITFRAIGVVQLTKSRNGNNKITYIIFS